jgi:hypothetical protein
LDHADRLGFDAELSYAHRLPPDRIDSCGRHDQCGRHAAKLFRYGAQAQRYCPDDTVVWLDFQKGIYYFKRQNRYGQGSRGSFVCRKEARSNGYRRSLLGLR